MPKRTKIIATLGPASSSEKVVRQLIEAGANIFRLNFSHGSHESHAAIIDIIRSVAKSLGKSIGILGDLCGPKIRIGNFANGQITLNKGQRFVLSQDQQVVGDEKQVSTSYPYLVKDVQLGNTILLDDGNFALQAVEKGADWVAFTVLNGGILKSKKGMNMPGIALSVETITSKDKEDLQFMIGKELDFVALSFVRKPSDLELLRSLIGNAPLQVIAKIEKPEAVEELEGILDLTDGVMIARGDLGVEMPIQLGPAIQKHILIRCYRRGIPVITATQMLESMIGNPRPTRAETTDVFNAILDGTDCVMLSGETAAGAYPVEAVQIMAAIAVEAEKLLAERNTSAKILPEVKHAIEDTVAHAACESAENVQARCIVAFTHSGNTAKNISKYHPAVPVFALTPREATCRRLSMCWGVDSILVPDLRNTDSMIEMAEKILLANGFVERGQIIVIVAGVPLGVKGNTNMIKLHLIK